MTDVYHLIATQHELDTMTDAVDTLYALQRLLKACGIEAAHLEAQLDMLARVRNRTDPRAFGRAPIQLTPDPEPAETT